MLPPSLIAQFDQFAASMKADVGKYRPSMSEAIELCALNFHMAAAAWTEVHPHPDETVTVGEVGIYLERCAEAWLELSKIMEDK